MAFSTTLPTQHDLPYTAYNIDWPVGLLGSNVSEDVMLVQALLRILFYEQQQIEPPAESTGVIAVDGLCGPITRAHIKHMQVAAVQKGHKVVVDGTFDPFRAGGQLSTKSRSHYAMELLNNGCYNGDKAEGSRYHKDLPSRADIPSALRNALKTVRQTPKKYARPGGVTVPETGGY